MLGLFKQVQDAIALNQSDPSNQKEDSLAIRDILLMIMTMIRGRMLVGIHINRRLVGDSLKRKLPRQIHLAHIRVVV